MRQGHFSIRRFLVVAGLAVMLSGCGTGLFPPVDVVIPAAVQVVLDNPTAFQAAADDPMQTIEPGTVVDDLNGLTGCWGTVFSGSVSSPPAALFVAYQLDSADGSLTRWSGYVMLDGSGLWPIAQLLSAEVGSFAVTGNSNLVFTVERSFVNIDPNTAQIISTLVENPQFSGPLDRPALVTLDGDSMLLFIDTETADEVNAADERAIFTRFDCPAEE